MQKWSNFADMTEINRLPKLETRNSKLQTSDWSILEALANHSLMSNPLSK